MSVVHFAAALGWWAVVAIPAFLIVLTLIVFIHELGHFLMGRLFGVKIESFSIGFGRAIVGFNDRHGTQWKVGWIPLGGYVKFWGDAGVSSNPDHEVLDHASAADRAQSFHHKPLYQRALIAAAGPIANFILAITIFSGMYMVFGDQITAPEIGRVVAGAPAETAGFQVGDRVVSIDGRSTREFSDIMEAVSLSGDHPLAFVVDRGGRQLAINVTPAQMERKDPLGNTMRDSMIGVAPVIPSEVGNVIADSPAAKAGLAGGDFVTEINGAPIENFDDIVKQIKGASGKPLAVVWAREVGSGASRDIKRMTGTLIAQPVGDSAASSDAYVASALGLVAKHLGSPKIATVVTYGPVEATVRAVQRTWFIVAKSLDFIGRLLTGSGDYRQLSGPIGIAQVSGQIIDQMGVGALIGLIAVLSVSIGLLNLFPIPMLDGGHLLYYGIEAVRGRPLGEKAQELGFQIGLALVVGLMLIATWNDLLKFRLF